MSLIAQVQAPTVDFRGLSPLIALVVGANVVLLAGLLRGAGVQRVLVPLLAAVTLIVAGALSVAIWETGDVEPLLQSALAMDTLTLSMSLLFYLAGLATIALSLRSSAVGEAGAGEYYTLLLASISGMVVLAAAENLITLFVGLELLSIPLYVLCGSAVRERASLESGLKYLVIGSVGSATVLYGLALIYGATGQTDLGRIAAAIGEQVEVGDPLLLTGIALTASGLAFKASVAPFHQWTPDVYQGAPTPITAFMAVATKTAAFAVFLRLFDAALSTNQVEWGPALAALALATILIGNVGAIGQRSLKRLLAWSGVAQAGYLLAGVVVGTRLGLQATAFYLATYLVMNVAAFAVIVARERVSERGDDISSVEGLGARSPLLAWPLTISMLGLAGFPATAGFMGKFYLIDAAVDGQYAWLGVTIVVGSMISLVYYLRVVAAMWMTPDAPPLAGPVRRMSPASGGSPEADARAQPETVAVALVCAALTIAIGIFPSPLFDLAVQVGTSISGI